MVASTLVAEEIARPVLVVVAPRSLAKRVKTFPRDLGNIPFVLYPPRCRYRWEIERMFDEFLARNLLLKRRSALGRCAMEAPGAAGDGS